MVGGSLEVKKTKNKTFFGLPPRNLECIIYAIGKPVFFKSTEQSYGAWMRDTNPYNEAASERIWMTKEDEPFRLYEYANKGAYRANNFAKIYNLRYPFQGNTHVGK